MKYLKKISVLLITLLMMSGCIKYRTVTTINKDKSVDFSIDYLIAEELQMNINDMLEGTEFDKRNIKVSELKEEGYIGIRANKIYKNIDDISTEENKQIIISDYLNEDFDDSIIFTVKKGFLKNTYSANFLFEYDSEDTSMDSGLMEDTTNEDTTTNDVIIEDSTTDSVTIEYSEEENESSDINFDDSDAMNNMMTLGNQMELSYTVVLPSKPISHNSKNVSEDGKTLVWNFIADESSTIEYTFSMLNIKNIIIIGGSLIGLIVLIIIIISVINNKNKNQVGKITGDPIHRDFDPSIANKIDENTNVNTENTAISNENTIVNTNISAPNIGNTEYTLPEETATINTVPQVPESPKSNIFVPNNPVQEEVELVPNNEPKLDMPNMEEINSDK